MSLFPIVAWERIPNGDANRRLIDWEHYLGACNRPFGRISFGLFYDGELVSVATAAFLVKRSIYGFRRVDSLECARLCTHPAHRDLTRVCLRLFRKTAPSEWAREYFEPIAILSYHKKDQHSGDIYRFDGWRFVRHTRQSKVGPGSHHSTVGRLIPAKGLWCFPLTERASETAHVAHQTYLAELQKQVAA